VSGAGFAALITLAGCAQSNAPISLAPSAPPAPIPLAENLPAKAPPHAIAAFPAPKPKHVIAAAAPVAAPAAAAIPLMAGWTEAAAIARMGQPSASETAGASQTLVWRAGPCEIRVAFFLDVTRNQYFALDQSTAGDNAACAERIASRVSNP